MASSQNPGGGDYGQASSSPYFQHQDGAGAGFQSQRHEAQQPGPSGSQPGGGGGRVLPGHPTGVGSIYSAFGDFEREARQRKYMIAECEDTLEGLKKQLQEREEKRKELSHEGDKLLAELKAADAMYEKGQKEKELIESKYQQLSNEMDILTESTIGRQTLLKKIEMSRQEKLAYAAKKNKEYKAAYLKVPAIAHLHKLKEQAEHLKAKRNDSKATSQELSQELESLTVRYSGDWGAFKNNCVKIAELNLELRKTAQVEEELCQEFNKAPRRPPVKPLGMGYNNFNSQAMPQSATQRSMYQQEPFTKKIGSIVVPVPRSRRPSSFQQMDRILKRPDTWQKYAAKSNSWNAQPENLMPPPPTVPGRSGASLVSELRSRVRSPVMINPMPRGLESPRASPSASASTSQESIISDSQATPASANSTFEDLTGKLQETVAVVNHPDQMEMTTATPDNEFVHQPNQNCGPIEERMDTIEGGDNPNQQSSGKGVSSGEADGVRGEKNPAASGTPNRLGAFGPFSTTAETPPSGFFGRDIFQFSPQSPPDKNDFFSNAPTTNAAPNPAGSATQDQPFFFFG